MTSDVFEQHVRDEAGHFAFIRSVVIVDKTAETVKARLHITAECFVQVYANVLRNKIEGRISNLNYLFSYSTNSPLKYAIHRKIIRDSAMTNLDDGGFKFSSASTTMAFNRPWNGRPKRLRFRLNTHRVADVDLFDRLAQVRMGPFYQEVIMCAHRAIGMHFDFIALYRLAYIIQDFRSVPLAPEDIRPRVSAIHHMIEGTWKFCSLWPRHPTIPLPTPKHFSRLLIVASIATAILIIDTGDATPLLFPCPSPFRACLSLQICGMPISGSK